MSKLWMNIVLVVVLFTAAGCDQQASRDASGVKKNKEAAKADPMNEGGHGWWCDEHGVVEDECSICQKEVFKKLKPDEICLKHPDRAKAQCFICNPELWEKSKAVYKAKFGKEPPEPADNMPEKK